MSPEEAIKKVDRSNFVLPDNRDQSGYDIPLDIGHGQTISQPYTVRLMLQWLDAKPKQKVLDVGSGSGWTTALLSHIVGSSGKIYAVERVPELLEFGRKNCERAGVENADFHLAGKVYGLPDKAPFDRILVSAEAPRIPGELVKQLKTGGKMVIPVGNSIFEVTKTGEDVYDTKEHHGFVFVPLVKS